MESAIEEEKGFMPDDEVGIGKQKEITRSGVGKVLSVWTEDIPVDGQMSTKTVLEVEVKEQKMKISKTKYISPRSKKLKVSGLWFVLDSEKKILGNSALAMMLRHYEAGKISDLVGKDLKLTSDDEGFLVVQSY